MTKIEDTVFCDNCGIEITWSPVVAGSRHYCCQDCYAGLQCNCWPLLDWDDEYRGEKASSIFLDSFVY